MKTKTFGALLLLLSVLGTRAAAADKTQKDDSKTFGLRNGRFWNVLEASERARYLEGIVDGWELRGHTQDVVSGRVISALSACGGSFTFDEAAEMITAAYIEPENRTLPVGWVMMADLAIQCGRTTRDAVFPALRKHLATIGDKTVSSVEISPIDTILSVSAK